MNRNHSISRFMDTVGDGSGVIAATGDYSSGGLGATSFRIKPSPGQIFQIERMIVNVADTTIAGDGYGTGLILTNGIIVREGDANGPTDYWTDENWPIKTCAHWAHYCYDAIVVAAFASGNDNWLSRWTFSKSGAPIILRGSEQEYLEVVLSDDFSHLASHGFLVQGQKVDWTASP